MPSGPFAHVCLLVHDLDQAIADWDRILDVLDPAQRREPIVRYEDFASAADSGLRWATYVNPHGSEIQFIQPAPGTPLGRRLEKHGEHVHHLCFTTQDVPGSLARLADSGIELASRETYVDDEMPWQRWGWVSAKSAHGVLIEVASPYESHGDGRWHPQSDALAEPSIMVRVTLQALPGRQEALLAALKEQARASREEAGCVDYRCSLDIDEEGRFHVLETWGDEQARRAHADAPHTRAFVAALPELGRTVALQSALLDPVAPR
ncbi:VOC family protein [Pseudomonas sp. NBRC 100443]|uniref:antibiotic biosynthesis monooxygenase n=1 Tax=Pseudomonas sp. NBRC 100443 TaxID=1113665 RepID=UPI0024A21C8C|nr:VOC family protein [Pseudomonas sp. NBRC 100443]GLU37372.1 hypothetical protein Pssp01_14650 [Pseudomonas sp. NBRC 100443]